MHDEPIDRRHAVGNRLAVHVDETQVAFGQQSEQPVAVIPVEKPASPALVMKIQKALSGMAYADVKVDGIPGEATRADPDSRCGIGGASKESSSS